jgi:low affinity Fe/Cu permease
MNRWFVDFANRVAEASRYPSVFAASVATILVWLATGPFFQFSDSWQLVMNTLTSVITFLMVFLIQTSQNRDSTALQASPTFPTGALILEFCRRKLNLFKGR